VAAGRADPPGQSSLVLRAAEGREVWRGGNLLLNESESLSLGLPASRLAPGDYTLVVEGIPAGRFAFRFLPAR
jgi:hypothetical protein